MSRIPDGHRQINNDKIRNFRRFMKKSKLVNPLMVTDSGEVVDLYSEALSSMEVGFIEGLKSQFRLWLSSVFFCLGDIFFKLGNMSQSTARIMMLFFFRLSNLFTVIGKIIQGRNGVRIFQCWKYF
jgi:hypothetical protein